MNWQVMPTECPTTPNDRNLDFDPKKNLFPASFPNANVNDP